MSCSHKNQTLRKTLTLIGYRQLIFLNFGMNVEFLRCILFQYTSQTHFHCLISSSYANKEEYVDPRVKYL